MEGILITILMFSVPILAAIIDKRLRAARKAQPQVHAEPIIFEEEEPEEQEEAPRAIVREPAVPVTAPVMPAPAVKTVQAAPVVKTAAAAPAAHHEDAAPIIREKAVPESFPTAEEIREDRRKLILYKEIMTPKFDNE